MNKTKKISMSIFAITIVISFLFVVFCTKHDNSNPMDPSYDGPLTEVSHIIGSSGGQVEVKNPASPIFGVKIIIPEGALHKDVNIAIKSSEPVVEIPHEGYERVGNPIELKPHGLVFEKDVSLKVPFKPSKEKSAIPIVAKYDPDTKIWEIPQVIDINPDSAKITVLIKTFSYIESLYDYFSGDIEIDPQFNFNYDTFPIPNTPIYIHDSKGCCWGIVVFSRWYHKFHRYEPLRNAWDNKTAENIAKEAEEYQISFANILNKLEAGFSTWLKHDYCYYQVRAGLAFENRPQIIGLTNWLNEQHAIMAYKCLNGNLYIYDPDINDPNSDDQHQILKFNITSFQPYDEISKYVSYINLKIDESGMSEIYDKYKQFISHCEVSRPDEPEGPNTANIGQELQFRTKFSSCSHSHFVEYRFDWGDGSSFSNWGNQYQKHTYTKSGNFPVKAQARCKKFIQYMSSWSTPKLITIAEDPKPVISVSPTSLSFYTVDVRISRKLPLRISNTGNATLNVTSISSSNSQFSVVSGATNFSIAAGGYKDISIQFSPSSTGYKSGTLSIYNNSSVNPKTVPMDGTGTAAPAPVIAVFPGSLPFGSEAVGSSKNLSLRITNTGNVTLSVTSISSTNSQFSVVSGDANFSISAGGNKDIKVRFSPISTGYKSGTLNIYNNSSVNPKNVPMDGTGIEAPPDINWISVPGSTFQMGDIFGDGSSNEGPLHIVTLSSFQMSKYEVTNSQYAAFLNAYGDDKVKSGHYASKTMIYEHDWGVKKIGGTWQPATGKENYPVIYVTWYGAYEFCQFYGWRLPTEAEWEYAARSGGNSEKWAGTSDVNRLGEYAWYYGNSGYITHAVGEKKPNSLGFCDMSGNVHEWCNDWYDHNYYSSSPINNPPGPATGNDRVSRGGSCNNSESALRCSVRSFENPNSRYNSVGFRCVR